MGMLECDSKMGSGKMMGMMKDMMGGKGDELELMAQSMDPEGLGADMSGAQKGGLGPNPFASGGAGLPPDLAGLLGNGKGKKR